jgi:hypothetical protein
MSQISQMNPKTRQATESQIKLTAQTLSDLRGRLPDNWHIVPMVILTPPEPPKKPAKGR